MCDFLMQLELTKFVASNRPLIAATKASERIVTIINGLLVSATPAQV